MIYWDYNAAAPVRREVATWLGRAYAEQGWGNTSSVHQGGRLARGRLDRARARVAQVLGCEPKEVCFTGSGSESNALALKGVWQGRSEPARRRVVSSAIEHPGLLAALGQLEALGAEVVRVPPGRSGQVPPQALLEALTPDTLLCSLMWANNETGVVQPVAELSRECRRRGILFHTDAVQAAGKLPLSLREVDADLLSLSAYKFGGPAGVGVLVVRKGVELQALVPGHQEGGRRGGTLSVPHAEALALALERACEEQPAQAERLAALRDAFEREVRARLPEVEVNGAGAPRVCNTSNLHLRGVEGETLLMALDLEGICASAGAACASGTLRPSHVLLAMGLRAREAQACVRFSLGPGTQESEVAQVVEALARHVPRARAV